MRRHVQRFPGLALLSLLAACGAGAEENTDAASVAAPAARAETAGYSAALTSKIEASALEALSRGETRNVVLYHEFQDFDGLPAKARWNSIVARQNEILEALPSEGVEIRAIVPRTAFIKLRVNSVAAAVELSKLDNVLRIFDEPGQDGSTESGGAIDTETAKKLNLHTNQLLADNATSLTGAITIDASAAVPGWLSEADGPSNAPVGSGVAPQVTVDGTVTDSDGIAKICLTSSGATNSASATDCVSTGQYTAVVDAAGTYVLANQPATLAVTGSSALTSVYLHVEDDLGNLFSGSHALRADIGYDRTAPSDGTYTAAAGSHTVVFSGANQAAQATDSHSGMMAETGATHPYKVVYAEGSTAPADCNSGTAATVVYVNVPLAGFTITATAVAPAELTNGTAYSFRVCGIDKFGHLSTGQTFLNITPKVESTAIDGVTAEPATYAISLAAPSALLDNSGGPDDYTNFSLTLTGAPLEGEAPHYCVTYGKTEISNLNETTAANMLTLGITETCGPVSAWPVGVVAGAGAAATMTITGNSVEGQVDGDKVICVYLADSLLNINNESRTCTTVPLVINPPGGGILGTELAAGIGIDCSTAFHSAANLTRWTVYRKLSGDAEATWTDETTGLPVADAAIWWVDSACDLGDDTSLIENDQYWFADNGAAVADAAFHGGHWMNSATACVPSSEYDYKVCAEDDVGLVGCAASQIKLNCH